MKYLAGFFLIFCLVFNACKNNSGEQVNNQEASPQDTVTAGAPEFLPESLGLFNPGNISQKHFHENLNYISKGMDTVYFTRSYTDYTVSTLYQSHFTESGWSVPQIVPFSGLYYDTGFALDDSGRTAFFTSRRNEGDIGFYSDWNIWKVAKNEEGWEEPSLVPAPVNSDSMECCMILNQKGNAYFSSHRQGNWNIYEAQYSNNNFSKIRSMPQSINSSSDDWPGYISPEGDLLIFSSSRSEGKGGSDLYYTRKVQGRWTTPKLMDDPINTSLSEETPLITPDQKYLLFSSQRTSELGDYRSNIWSVPLNSLKDSLLSK